MMEAKYTAIVVDDEEHCRESLVQELKWSCPEVQVVSSASSKTMALEAINEYKPDILFLDIEMPGGGGFELLNEISKPDFFVIFTTAYEEFALKAFQVDAVDYLLKPIDGDELKKAVSKVQASTSNNTTKVLEMLKNLEKSRIKLPVSDGFEIVDKSEVVRCESEGAYTHIYLKTKKIFLSKTLKQIHELLGERDFVRVHHSHVVNIGRIQKYLKGKGGEIILDNGTHIPVSRARKDDLLERL